jgi:uncharacterized damage-inducible protein DinB
VSGAPREAWLRGPVEGVPDALQPVAHALLQAAEEVEALVRERPDLPLWTRPAGVASAGFHLRHMAGVVDRLLTYARGDALDAEQRTALAAEAAPDESQTPAALAAALRARVDATVEALRSVDPAALAAPRSVGRAALPSTVGGLLFHAAEHTMRHLGQLLVTVRVQDPG